MTCQKNIDKLRWNNRDITKCRMFFTHNVWPEILARKVVDVDYVKHILGSIFSNHIYVEQVESLEMINQFRFSIYHLKMKSGCKRKKIRNYNSTNLWRSSLASFSNKGLGGCSVTKISQKKWDIIPAIASKHLDACSNSHKQSPDNIKASWKIGEKELVVAAQWYTLCNDQYTLSNCINHSVDLCKALVRTRPYHVERKR